MSDQPTTEAARSPLAQVIIDWFAASARDLPWRRDGFTAWGKLVSEVMLQQTPAARVIPHLEAWLKRWPTPGDLAAEPAGEAVRAWSSLGYPRRALRLHACAVAITERYDGVVPDDVDALLALPGIGDYTARAVAVFAYGRRHPVVDTNIRRVISRAVSGQAQPKPPARGDLAAMEALLPNPEAEAAAFTAGIMELGQVICTARSPLCDVCPIRHACAWRKANYPAYDGKQRAKQKRFTGSDRQVRGLILARLRSTNQPLGAAEIEPLWSDAPQRDRALAGLITDGLAVLVPEHGYALVS